MYHQPKQILYVVFGFPSVSTIGLLAYIVITQTFSVARTHVYDIIKAMTVRSGNHLTT